MWVNTHSDTKVSLPFWSTARTKAPLADRHADFFNFTQRLESDSSSGGGGSQAEARLNPTSFSIICGMSNESDSEQTSSCIVPKAPTVTGHWGGFSGLLSGFDFWSLGWERKTSESNFLDHYVLISAYPRPSQG